MSDFMRYVINYLGRALALAVPAALLCGAGLVIASLIQKKKYGGGKKFPWLRAILRLMLVGYLAVVLYVTIFRAGHAGWRHASLDLFRAWREAWNNFSEKHWLNVLLNIGMFTPLGILLPLMGKKLRKWPWMLGAGFLTSLSIETAQYILCRGLFDVDDLFCNTLGAMIGYWLVMTVIRGAEKKPKKALCHAAALLAVAAGIGGIFAAYSLQEYGNLPDAPAFRINTSDVEWTVDFRPDAAEGTVSVYHLEPPSRAECEAFGREFMERAGVEQVDVTLYNEEVYLREYQGSRFLEVYYLDGTFDYYDWNDFDIMEPEYSEADEQTLRAALAELGVTVPESALLSREEDGGYRFTCDRQIEGETLTDGSLWCGYVEGYGIRELKNALRTFTLYGETAVISEQDAVEQVMAGWLSDGDWFQRVKPRKIEILSCTLSYRVDTKGFYQPVYLIELASADTDYAGTVLIPAAK